MMFLVIRLFRALFAFAVILSSYLVQIGLVRIFARRTRNANGILTREIPPWLLKRRKEVDKKNARRLLRDMLRLRGVYIKLGQVLSIMGGFLPRVYSKELEQLQDNVPPQPFSVVERAIRKSFGKSPEDLFHRIEETPIAAASLGQVHLAYLRDGRKVAVKFLYPKIRGIIAVDMRVLSLALSVYRRFVPVTKLERVHESLVDLLRRETDYIHEADCMNRMAENFKNDAGITFPQPVSELTTRDVLTMTFMEGFKITKLTELAAHKIEPAEVATRLVQSFYKMLFVDRFFHADPHPGNFLVEPLGEGSFRIVVLDFGAICDARDELVDGMIEILVAFFSEDDQAVVRGFHKMGFVAEGANDALLDKTVRAYFSKLLKVQDRSASALMRASTEQLQQLVDPEVERQELQELMRSVEYPEDWFYVERACVVIYWLAGQIDPTLDTLSVGLPYVMPLLAERAMRASARVAPNNP